MDCTIDDLVWFKRTLTQTFTSNIKPSRVFDAELFQDLSISPLLLSLSVIYYSYILHPLLVTITHLTNTHFAESSCDVRSTFTTLLKVLGLLHLLLRDWCFGQLPSHIHLYYLLKQLLPIPLLFPLSLCRSRQEKWSRYVYRWDFRIVVCILSSHEWLVKCTQSVRHREICIILLS